MREIKFRAFNKKDKLYQDVYSVEFLNGGIKALGTGVYIGNGWVTEDNGFKHECDVVLEQFTGLKDKDGVDIYEGDILAFNYFDDDDDEIYSVVFGVHGYSKTVGFHCIDANLELSSFYGGIPDCDAIRVIGNIHQNPELLK